MGEESGEFLAVDASVSEHMAAHRRVVEYANALVERLSAVQAFLHDSAKHGDQPWHECPRAICRSTKALIDRGFR